MKSINKLSTDILVWNDKVIQNAIEKQKEAAEKICQDVKTLAPGNGEYKDSIKVSDTICENNVIKTSIYTDLLSNGHVIGRMIENGTGIYALESHIGLTKTFFESEYNYWFVPSRSVKRPIGCPIIIKGELFYIARAQKPKPHFLPALNANREYFKQKMKESFKI